MKKNILLAVTFLLAGCPTAHNVNLYSAQSKIINNKICVFVDKTSMVKDENILKVSIWQRGGSYVYEKSYAINPAPLIAGKCIPDISNFNFAAGIEYSAIVDTPLNTYESRFSLARQNERLVLHRTGM